MGGEEGGRRGRGVGCEVFRGRWVGGEGFGVRRDWGTRVCVVGVGGGIRGKRMGGLERIWYK